tara:strand:- start:200 stop:484 length:285 start_codon:yes stop_codon:yes gene_type:complete
MLVGKGSEMIAVIRNNKALRRQKTDFRDLRKQYVRAAKKKKTTYERADRKQLLKIRKKVRRQERMKALKSWIALLISIGVVVLIAYYLYTKLGW